MNPQPLPIGDRDLFPILQNWNFINHAAVSPLSRPAADALRRYTDQAEKGSYLGTSWFADIDKVRQSAATLIHASPDEIALTKNTSEGISTVARGLTFSPGDRIVTTGVEYPANIYPWMDLARHSGVELELIAEEHDADGTCHVPLDKLMDAIAKPRTRLLSVSHVEFASGQRLDLEALGKFCRERNIYFCVDAIQSIGALPIDVQAMHIDFLAAGGHKWLLSPLGTGILYCRKELIEPMRPLMVGASSVVNDEDYGHYDFTLKPSARRFESGASSFGGLFGLRASIELFLSMGVDRIATRIHQISTRLASGLQAKGYQVISPRNDDAWSGIVCFVAPGHEDQHAQIVRSLRKEHQTEIALREGRLRASPHFYNTETQIDALLQALPAL